VVLVPRQPLEELIRRQAEAVAVSEVAYVAHTMALEDQALTEEAIRPMVRERTDALLYD